MPLNLDLSLPRPKMLLFSVISTESVPDLTAEMFLGTLLLTASNPELVIPALQLPAQAMEYKRKGRQCKHSSTSNCPVTSSRDLLATKGGSSRRGAWVHQGGTGNETYLPNLLSTSVVTPVTNRCH